MRTLKVILQQIKRFSPLWWVGGLLILLISCDEEYTPKPRGFFRITLPEKSYRHYVSQDCPFEFDIPNYAQESKDSSKHAEPCFLNIDFPTFNATIYLSYKPVHNDLKALYEEHRAMTMKHIPKASGIDEQAYNDPDHRVFGSTYLVKGAAASNIQFYLTDSTKNFIRGSLYFNNVPQADSLAPVLEFVTADVKHLVETFRWK